MTPWQETIIAFFLILSGIFGLVGSYGLIKLSTPMARLHGPTKATTLGVGGVLVASMLYVWFSNGTLTFHELLVAVFLFLTAPITANFIAKMHLHQKTDPTPVPPTGTGSNWAVMAADTKRDTH